MQQPLCLLALPQPSTSQLPASSWTTSPPFELPARISNHADDLLPPPLMVSHTSTITTLPVPPWRSLLTSMERMSPTSLLASSAHDLRVRNGPGDSGGGAKQ